MTVRFVTDGLIERRARTLDEEWRHCPRQLHSYGGDGTVLLAMTVQ
jgi:hypothetical protein